MSHLHPEDIFYGIVGLCVGDALGVPVEFTPRGDLARYPIDDMVGYGVHGQEPGTWSDDTSLTLALLDSLSNGVLDYCDIMNNFSKWLNAGAYTANGEVFDVGNTTNQAILNYSRGIKPLECGGQALSDNGNGSLMRILPAMYFLSWQHCGIMNKDAIVAIHALSALTHAHNISKMACVIYCNVAFQLLTCRQICHRDNADWNDAELRRPFLHQFVTTGIQEALAYYSAIPEYAKDCVVFERLEDREFRHYLPSEIKSSGYVVDTLEAAIWCLLNNNDYSGTVLTAVNLGGDTDTTAAVAGGLAGLFYQDDFDIGIPKHWINEIINLDLVKVLCNKFCKTLCADQDDYEYWGEN
ncbi:MAG: ADP-ribosylglycohydrolase family protein [Clostridiales Family XIII bacterium]|nr:ADP-ribosylglycohydrolase family protein [Clostridiales Family XIII bacterium]